MPTKTVRTNSCNSSAHRFLTTTGGATLPVTFKLGEDENGNAVYHTFKTMDDFSDFYSKAVRWVNGCIADGWIEKDSVDYESMLFIDGEIRL